MSNEPIIVCDNLVKIYKVADLEVVALQGLDLVLNPGEIMALVGPSGAGKSTLLNLLGGLDVPSAGSLAVAGRDLLKMSDRDRVVYKREAVGFVWQQPARNLLPYLTARENVELPMLLSRVPARDRKMRALELLEMVGLADRVNFHPDRLSGGQQQRVALAIALANNPPLLLGDELTGQVDSESANEVFEALRRITKRFGTTIVVVTHDPKVASKVDRVVAIRDGRTSTEVRRSFDARGKILEEEWVILDSVGRLQLPKPYVETLEMEARVKVKLEPDHVSVWPSDKVPKPTPAKPETPGEAVTWKPPSMTSFLKNLADPYEKKPPEAAAAALPGAGTQPEPSAPASPPRAEFAVELDDLWRTFVLGAEKIHAVQNISLKMPAGKMFVLKGRSGSGKTTLLNLIAGLDEPTQGTVMVNGRPLAKMPAREQITMRRREIGFVYQTFGLLPYLSAGENVEVPLRMVRTPRRARRERVREALGLVGLADRMEHRTYELSGGEQQRVALARALANRPMLLLADEPTGQLDTATGASIITLLRDVMTQTGVTVVVASHDPNVHEAADVVFDLEDGRLVG